MGRSPGALFGGRALIWAGVVRGTGDRDSWATPIRWCAYVPAAAGRSAIMRKAMRLRPTIARMLLAAGLSGVAAVGNVGSDAVGARPGPTA